VVAVAARADRILGAGELGRATVWHADRIRRLSSTTIGRPVLAATFGSRPLVLVGGAKRTSLWDAAAGIRVLSLPHRAEIGALNQPGRVAATARGRDIQVWDADGGLVARLEAPKPVSALALSTSGARLVAGGVDGKLRVWDVSSRTRIATLEHSRYPIRSVGFDRSGRLLVTTAVSPDIQARVWETATWRPLYRPFKHFGSVAGASFSPDGRWLATAGPKAVWIWELRSGRLLFLVQGNRGPLTALAWTSGNRIVSGSGDPAGTVATYVCSVCGDAADLLRAAESMLERSRAG
jgi:cytochrome c